MLLKLSNDDEMLLICTFETIFSILILTRSMFESSIDQRCYERLSAFCHLICEIVVDAILCEWKRHRDVIRFRNNFRMTLELSRNHEFEKWSILQHCCRQFDIKSTLERNVWTIFNNFLHERQIELRVLFFVDTIASDFEKREELFKFSSSSSTSMCISFALRVSRRRAC